MQTLTSTPSFSDILVQTTLTSTGTCVLGGLVLGVHQSGIGVAPACIGNATGYSESHWVTTEPWWGLEEVKVWFLSVIGQLG